MAIDDVFVLVSGGRDYKNQTLVNLYLNTLKKKFGKFTLIHGAARGADSLAAFWVLNQSEIKEIKFAVTREEWKEYGKYAGHRRNQIMANFLVEKKKNGAKIFALIFPGGKGTQNMYNLCLHYNIPHYKIKE
jgi:mRNA deadenylase 3'-5' endonuclease subunit Ccr4